MLTDINTLLYIITIIIGSFMIERYVLLEPPMEHKKQTVFYAFSFISILLSYPFLKDNTDKFILILAGLNIVLGRKKHRLPGFLLVIPLIGIMNGIAAPILVIRTNSIFFGDETFAQVEEFALYIVIALLLTLFYFKGKNWRIWFRENMKDRRPSAGEYCLICASGILIAIFSNLVTYMVRTIVLIVPQAIKPDVESLSGWIVNFYLATSFLLTITIIVMIMHGNKRKFYHDKVSNMQFSIIATMADIVENRDENTGGHIKRTAKYVELIGKKLRSEGKFQDILTEEYLSDMIVAAPLHDIGKIHIPDSILNKPGRLTEEEFEVMKTHTTAGRDVLLKAKDQLGEFDYLNTALEMAEYHHEWWNGKGYPEAISGEEIPLCARVMAVADVFDALTAKRCYKAAMPLEKAFSIIEEETGTHFDPVVAKAFLDLKAAIAADFEQGE